MKRQFPADKVANETVTEQTKGTAIECRSKNDSTLPSRLGKCEVCAASDAQYTCPKCEVKTCCLRCVQIHKKELSCDGIRDRTKYIPLRKMTKMDFMNDYYFLEECTRYVEDRKSDRIKSFTRYNKILPAYLFKLRNAAAKRKIKLRFLLQNFSRSRENTTFFNWKQHKIFWRVEWIFVNAGNLKYADERCDEDVPLSQLLDKYLNPRNVEDVPRKKDLEHYQSVGAFCLKVLLKAEGIKRSQSRFHSLDVKRTLKENLANKTLVEFPCIFLLYETNSDGFDVIDSDEDVEAETKSHEEELEKVYQQQRLAARKKPHNSISDEENSKAEGQKKSTEKKREERNRMREEFEKAPNNYLFTDEKLWDILSSSDTDDGGNQTEEEK